MALPMSSSFLTNYQNNQKNSRVGTGAYPQGGHRDPRDHMLTRLSVLSLVLRSEKPKEGKGAQGDSDQPLPTSTQFKCSSEGSRLTPQDAAGQKPSAPQPGLLQSWPGLGDSLCTAGPESGLWLTKEKQPQTSIQYSNSARPR